MTSVDSRSLSYLTGQMDRLTNRIKYTLKILGDQNILHKLTPKELIEFRNHLKDLWIATDHIVSIYNKVQGREIQRTGRHCPLKIPSLKAQKGGQ